MNGRSILTGELPFGPLRYAKHYANLTVPRCVSLPTKLFAVQRPGRYDNCSQAIVIDCGKDGLAIRPTWLISLASILSLVCFVASRIIWMCEVAALSLNAAR